MERGTTQTQRKNKAKRATADILIIANEKEDLPNLVSNLLKDIRSMSWDYKSEYKTILQKRDKGLVALLVLSGLRISEALALKVPQVNKLFKCFTLTNVHTLKNGLTRDRIVIPIDGSLGKLAVFFDDWYNYIKQQSKAEFLFPSACGFGLILDRPLSRYRAHRIIKVTINKFPHWFRAVYENIYGHIIFNNNPYKLKRCMGLKRLDSTVPYVQADYENDIAKVYLV